MKRHLRKVGCIRTCKILTPEKGGLGLQGFFQGDLSGRTAAAAKLHKKREAVKTIPEYSGKAFLGVQTSRFCRQG
ncbi:TPA: hypothetical protein HA338_06550 [Methanosarcina acetivorans]|uniref:Uncharacterized protein n=1 Tax=Methanosarcina acetivorans TaxID=2214 RepID=A0A832S7V0_9EURY|nr:hypothetical protein [Methanosarcina acetivorans]HIH93701.1 hypothetical protein [Methanosarcina acetivorans]